MVKVLYASDLDRTLIFSSDFLKENPSEDEITVVETCSSGKQSFISTNVKYKLSKLCTDENIQFIPITSRSIEEYNRIDLGFKPEYAVVACGGVILHHGEPLKEWEDYIKSQRNSIETLTLIQDLSDLDTIESKVRVVDNSYIFFKVTRSIDFDIDIQSLKDKYTGWQFTRQGNKMYIVPNYFSKQVALRWLWHRLNKPCIVASGDSLLDVPMLTLANKAVIPDHSMLVKDKIVENGRFATGGITSPLITIRLVEDILCSNHTD